MTTDNTRQELYASTRQDLLTRQLSNNENFDKAILTLSSAGLATSIAFLRGMKAESYVCFLVLSWLAFVIAIIATLVSYQMSQVGIRRQLELAERYYLRAEESALEEPNSAAKWTDHLALISGGAFILGIILLLLFFGANLTANQ